MRIPATPISHYAKPETKPPIHKLADLLREFVNSIMNNLFMTAACAMCCVQACRKHSLKTSAKIQLVARVLGWGLGGPRNFARVTALKLIACYYYRM